MILSHSGYSATLIPSLLSATQHSLIQKQQNIELKGTPPHPCTLLHFLPSPASSFFCQSLRERSKSLCGNDNLSHSMKNLYAAPAAATHTAQHSFPSSCNPHSHTRGWLCSSCTSIGVSMESVAQNRHPQANICLT